MIIASNSIRVCRLRKSCTYMTNDDQITCLKKDRYIHLNIFLIYS